ncbi:MAG: hypothetical protein SGJ05_00850 [bacterium]|nr:hypothetical protein [bacterium]
MPIWPTQTGGPVAVGRGAMWGVTMSIVMTVVYEISMCMWFNYSNTTMAAVNIGWDALAWGITGAVMAVIYSKLYKA